LYRRAVAEAADGTFGGAHRLWKVRRGVLPHNDLRAWIILHNRHPPCVFAFR